MPGICSVLRASLRKSILVWLLLFIVLPFIQLNSQEKTRKPKQSPILKLDKKSGKPHSLSLSDIVRLVLHNSDPVRIQQLEILKSDTGLRKSNSIYAPTLEGGWQKQVTRQRYTNSFTRGDTIETNTAYLRAKKLFSTGTYFETEAADTRIGSEEVDNPALSTFTGSGGAEDIFSPATLHTTGLSVVLRQELLKNAFGYSYRRNQQIQRNQAQIERQDLIYELSKLVAQTMTDFWQLAIAEENIRTARRLLQNVRNIRTITIRKRRLGLAEAFEINQWNALVSTAQTRQEQARLQRDGLQRDLLRIMNLEPGLALSGATQLEIKVPKDLNPKKSLEVAYRTRPDLKSMQLQKENAEKSFEVAKNQLLPSLSINGKYTGQGFDRDASEAFDQSVNRIYPEYSFGFQVEYPLWDEGLRVDARNAKINLQIVAIQERQLRRQIRDEITSGIQQIRIAHSSLVNSIKSLRATRSFYTGLLRRYRQGRFSAAAIKDALDSLVQAEQSRTEAAINFNIALVRFEVIRNNLFKKYSIDIDKVVDRMRSKLDQFESLD